MKKRKITKFMILFFFIGLLILFYPTLSNYYNEKNQSKSIYTYESIIDKYDEEKFQTLKEEAISYNKKLSSLKEPLLTYKSLKNYKKTLNVNNDGMMGYLTIDKIKVAITTIINHFSSELSFLLFSLFAIIFYAPIFHINFLDGKNLSKFYGLGLEEFLYFLLNITV